jgi:hypothetical protein
MMRKLLCDRIVSPVAEFGMVDLARKFKSPLWATLIGDDIPYGGVEFNFERIMRENMPKLLSLSENWAFIF